MNELSPDNPSFAYDMEAETISRRAKVSEVGDFPDKGISFTESDFDAASEGFAPVPMDYEHVDGPLDGHLGKLTRIWRDGTALFGEFAVPSWLQSIFTEKQITPKVSLTWDKREKKIIKCAWVVNPRIPDAVLMSAFSASGRMTPASTSTASDPGTLPPPKPAARKANPMASAKEIWEKLAAFAMGAAKETDGTDDPAKPVTDPAPKVAPSPVVAPTPDPQIAAMSAEIAQLKKQNILTDATAFADRMLSEKRIIPGERDGLIAELSQAAMDDNALPAQVAFSVGGEAKTGSRVDAKKAMMASKTPHVLLEEIGGGLPEGAGILYPDPSTAEMSATTQAQQDAEVRKLLSYSDIGRSALARKGGK